jgi:hypothetical protein
MTPELFEAFADARSETAHIGWGPDVHSPTLPQRLCGVTTPMLLVLGTRDKVMLPREGGGTDRRAGARRSFRGPEMNA